jgi:hypothetical protein
MTFNRRPYRRLGLLSSLCLLVVTVQPTQAEKKDSMRGLSGLQVVVEDIDSDAAQNGLRRSDVQTDVELKLRLAGITVLTEEQNLASAASPFIHVVITTLKSQNRPGLYSYDVSVQLKQWVTLANGSHTYAGTWGDGSIGIVGTDKLRTIRDSVKDVVDAFINDWLAVNPKR